MQFDIDTMHERSTAVSDLAAAAAPWKSVEVVRGRPETSILILCDHATNLLPPEYGSLGLPPSELERHIAYDIGALPVALDMGRRLGATVVHSRFSRLLIDPNRGLDDPTLIMQLSDGAIVPGNRKLNDSEMEKRIARFFKPYHAAIRQEIAAMTKRNVTPSVFSLHSYTDVWHGVFRPWHGAVLWDKDPRLPVPLMGELAVRTDLKIGDNEPYSGRLRGNTIYEHGALNGFAHVLFEIRQDLIRENEGQRAWAALLSECLAAICADPVHAERLRAVEFYGSHTDVQGGERHSL